MTTAVWFRPLHTAAREWASRWSCHSLPLLTVPSENKTPNYSSQCTRPYRPVHKSIYMKLAASLVPSYLLHLSPGPTFSKSCHLQSKPSVWGCLSCVAPLSSPGEQRHPSHVFPLYNLHNSVITTFVPILIPIPSLKVIRGQPSRNWKLFKFIFLKLSWDPITRTQLLYVCALFPFVFTHEHNDHITVKMVPGQSISTYSHS